MTEEEKRLEQARAGHEPWKQWGPYLSERAWGTVREDYSADGSAWDSFPHDHARSRVYRWNEDGLAGISDDHQLLCFALALWNGHDPILKERLFGLTGNEGNHGEDLKECYYYLDSTPTHSYLKCLYKYPQRAFPYRELVAENRRRGKDEPEYELIDTGIFAEDRYFDVVTEYAKAAPDDLLIQYSITNHGPEAAAVELIPTLWFRNTWAWGYDSTRPHLSAVTDLTHQATICAEHQTLGTYGLTCQSLDGEPELLFTENESNKARLFQSANSTPYVKDGINDYIVAGKADAVNPDKVGTKAAARYRLIVKPGETRTVRLRLATKPPPAESLGAPFENILALRRHEADAFYATVAPAGLSDDARAVQRQALACSGANNITITTFTNG